MWLLGRSLLNGVMLPMVGFYSAEKRDSGGRFLSRMDGCDGCGASDG